MLQAYLDRLSVDAGASIGVHASDAPNCHASVVRLRHSDPHPAGPGILEDSCPWGALTFSAPAVPPARGSYATIDGAFDVMLPGAISVWHLPTVLDMSSTILSWQSETAAWSLGLSAGLLTLAREGDTVAQLGLIHHVRQWYFLGVGFHPDGGVDLFSGQWGRTGGPFLARLPDVSAAPARSSLLWVGAKIPSASKSAPVVAGNLDGRIAGPVIHPPGVDVVDLMNEMNGIPVAGAMRWDLANLDDPDACPSRDGGPTAMVLHQAPARSGATPPPVDDVPRSLVDGGSVHFHRDDLEDPGWPQVARLEIPADAESGCYSLRLASGAQVYDLPFIVRARKRVTLLIPTLTWQAYGNLGRDPQMWPGRSHYSVHTDGSPVYITTTRRPCQTFAPSARLEVDEADGFATGTVLSHLLMADLYADYWLTSLSQQGVIDDHGVIDDRDLHFGGLHGVDVLVLSAHPEYWTSQMLDAVETFLARGGSILCLGGNALYWVSVLHPRKPHLLEVRRWNASQTTSADPDDRIYQFSSRRGGTWSDAGRPPNRILGVAFTGFGCGPSMTFERTEQSYSEEFAWVFDGVASASFGGDGINTGTGNEFDRFDESRATAGRTVVLARSSPRTDDHFGGLEEHGARAPSPTIRADVTMTTTAAGGYVFTLASISASGCLVASHGSSDLARICRNVLTAMVSGTSAAQH